MGRALVRNSPVLLFDEPLSNLDAKLRTQMRAEIKKLHFRLKKTSVYVTHDQVEAMTLADRIVVMNNGYIEQIGKPLELYHHPANTFVAEFIGSPPMNLITAKRDGGKIEISEKSYVPIPNFLKDKVKEGHEIILGIRPESFDLIKGNQSLKLKIHLVEPLGADTLIHSEINGKKIVIKLLGEHLYEMDSEIVVKFFLENCHFFNYETKKIIPGSVNEITH